MNDADYQSTLECLRIAMRLIMPLDLDGFLARVEHLPGAAQSQASAEIRRLARLARAMREAGAEARCTAPRAMAGHA
jgi:hypothetical protein